MATSPKFPIGYTKIEIWPTVNLNQNDVDKMVKGGWEIVAAWVTFKGDIRYPQLTIIRRKVK